MIEERIQCARLHSRIASPREAALLIKNGHTVAVSGYTNSGYPKAIPAEMLRRRKEGEEYSIQLLSCSNIGPEIDEAFALAGMLTRRAPLHESKEVARLANSGKLHYMEIPLNRMPRLLASHVFGDIDVAIVEALGITEEGYIIPSTSIGLIPHYLKYAKSVIVEINTVQPLELAQIHDIYYPEGGIGRAPIPLTDVNQKIGVPYLRVDPEKIKYIVESNILDTLTQKTTPDDTVISATRRLMDFLEHTYQNKKLPPIQTGIGNVAEAVVDALGKSGFQELDFFCGGIQEQLLRLLPGGKLHAVSTGSVAITQESAAIIRQYPEEFQRIFIMRNSDVTNNAETIGRMGIIAINSAIEIDIYGNANTSHLMGTNVVNGIGGGANFMQNAALSILLLPSTRKCGNISSIVPMAPHQDISEHDVDVIVTENGVADLRGLDELERACAILEHCVHETYRDPLRDYIGRAAILGGHHPHILEEAFSWHTRLKETGTMRIWQEQL